MAFGFLKRAISGLAKGVRGIAKGVVKGIGFVAKPALSIGARMGIPGLTQAKSVFDIGRSIFSKEPAVSRPVQTFPVPALPPVPIFAGRPGPVFEPQPAFQAQGSGGAGAPAAPDRTMLIVAGVGVLIIVVAIVATRG